MAVCSSVGVVNGSCGCGCGTYGLIILNNKFVLKSVALIVKVVTVSCVTIVGFPDKAPLLIFNVIWQIRKFPIRTRQPLML